MQTEAEKQKRLEKLNELRSKNANGSCDVQYEQKERAVIDDLSKIVTGKCHDPKDEKREEELINELVDMHVESTQRPSLQDVVNKRDLVVCVTCGDVVDVSSNRALKADYGTWWRRNPDDENAIPQDALYLEVLIHGKVERVALTCPKCEDFLSGALRVDKEPYERGNSYPVRYKLSAAKVAPNVSKRQ